MKRLLILLTVLCATLVSLPTTGSRTAAQGKKRTKQPIVSSASAPLTTVAIDPTALGGIISIDYQESTDSLIVSVHATNGQPNNLVRVTRAGVITQFSTASGFPEEVQVAVAPSQNCSGTGLSLGGFTVGDVFVGSGFGTGAGSTIARISADGSTVQNPFATLPGETGLVWGGLYFDRTGNFGGDLMVCTTTGGIYRVNSAGVATLVARHPTNGAVETIITLPNDARFGPLSGKILVGGTDIGIPSTGETNILAVDPIDAMHPMGTFTTYSVPDIIEPEGFRIVPAGGDFFGTDFLTSSVVTAPASGFSSIVGDLVVASEGEIDPVTKTSKLFDVVWDPVNNQLKTTEIPGGRVFQYEGITFSCTAPGGGCTPSTLTCPASVCVPAAGPTAVTFTAPVTMGGTNNPNATAVCVPPSGSVFAVGTTPVNCTAPNGCGGTASCGFNVTVSTISITIVDFGGSGSSFTVNLATGAYTFRCGNGFSVSGIGKVTVQGGMILIEDLQGDRCIEVKIDTVTGRASGALKSPMGTLRCTIQGRNLELSTCL